jgi:chemotaxis family two-component system response regulator Rcp1
MTTDNKAKPLEILLVEDNPGDVRFTAEVLKEAQVRNNLSVAKDGVEAIAFLRRQGQFANAPRPDLILLDLNLPKKNGLEMLNEIKNTDELKSIPVVILTTSETEPDINRSFDLSANCYITKPIDVERLTMVLNSIKGAVPEVR